LAPAIVVWSVQGELGVGAEEAELVVEVEVVEADEEVDVDAKVDVELKVAEREVDPRVDVDERVDADPGAERVVVELPPGGPFGLRTQRLAR